MNKGAPKDGALAYQNGQDRTMKRVRLIHVDALMERANDPANKQQRVTTAKFTNPLSTQAPSQRLRKMK